MATKYGIELRKIRIEREETLLRMADKLEISISYLSSIENGLRKIPEDLTKKIISLYSLNKEHATKLEEAENLSVDVVNINLMNLNNRQKELAFLLSRRLPNIDNTDEIISLLLKGDKNE